jgi:hypothetical protein
MPSKQFEEKQIVKEVDKEKELQKHEKNEKLEKPEKNEKAEKEHKDQKDGPDTKQNKDGKDQKDGPDTKHKQEKEKHEKEQKHEKIENKEFLLEKVHKDQEAQISQAPFALSLQAGAGAPKVPEKALIAEKLPQPETKIVKEIKHEIKEVKHEKIEIKEKVEVKEFKAEKLEFEGLRGVNEPGGPVEQRLAALEAAMTQLLHFIPENLRPDLSQGALKQESDAAKHGASGTKPADPKADPQQKPKS